MSDEMNEHAGPELSPSGKKPIVYGEVLIRVWLMGDSIDNIDGAEAVIDTPSPDMPFECLVAAAEHLLTAVAMRSGAGFEHAIQLVVEGAKTNKGRLPNE